jgi:hypothetical protein
MKARDARTAAATAVSALAVFNTVIFLSASVLHLGLRVSIGSVVVELGQITAASIAEALIGVFFGLAAFALVQHVPHAWRAAVGAHLFGLAGVLVGLGAVSSGTSPYRALNVAYHGAMLVAIVAGIVLLLTPGVRTSMRQGKHDMEVRFTDA